MSDAIATVIDWNDEVASDWGIDLPAAGIAATEASLAVTIARHIGWNGKAAIRPYNGKPYLILYGNPGERPKLPGTRYLPSNPKVVAAGLGPVASARHLVRVTLIGIILYTAIDITRYVIEDSYTWQELLGQIGVDIGKAQMAQIDSLLDLLPAIPSSFTTEQQQKLIARAQGRRNRPL